MFKSTKRARGSVYRRVEEDMRRRIASGRWQEGLMIPSRRDLAKEYGVDLRTLQRAVEALLRDGTLVAQSGRGTFVRYSSSAGSFAGREADLQTIVVVHDQAFTSSHPGLRFIFNTIDVEIQNALREFRVVIFNVHGRTYDELVRRESEAFDFIENEDVAGALIYPSSGAATVPQIARIVERGIPVVMVDRHPETIECDFVGIDNQFSAREAVGYAISLGHRRIGFVSADEDISSVVERLKGYRIALSRAGIDASPELEFRPHLEATFSKDGWLEELRKVARRIQEMADPPTALFAVNDIVAYHLITAFSSEGIEVPKDMSVIGFDDIDRFSPRSPFLTTMRQPFDAISERASEMLLRRIASKPAHGVAPTCHTVLLPTTLIVRDSCRPRP